MLGRVTLLDADLLARIHDRAAGYDRDNLFFTEDLEELVADRTRALKEAFDEQAQIRTFAQTISDNQRLYIPEMEEAFAGLKVTVFSPLPVLSSVR